MELTGEQQSFIDSILDGQENVLLLGKAGVGKSLTVNHLIELAKAQKKNFFIAAPTGVAALNIGGQTLHWVINFLRNYDVPRLDFCLIDEVSMCRPDLLDTFDSVLRRNFNRSLPFGGVRIGLVGDPAQLPPVFKRDNPEDQEILERYLSPYFFSARVFGQSPWKIIELTKIFRQADSATVDILNSIRGGEHQHIDSLNETRQTKRVRGIILTGTNKAALEINTARLAKLEGEANTFRAAYGGKFSEREFPTEQELRVKVGARVICIKNLYLGEGRERVLAVVNGDTGEIAKIEKDAVWMKLDRNGDVFRLPVCRWAKTEKEVVDGELVDVETGYFSQLPLRLAWAITIHKAQGSTLEEATIDLRKGLFENGQAYVAFSRVKDISGLWLYGKLSEDDVKACEIVKEFLAKKLDSRYIWRGLEDSGEDLDEEWNLEA